MDLLSTGILKQNLCHDSKYFDKSRLPYLLMIVTITLTWVAFSYNKFAVPSEGWYVVYADMILNGKTPYVDFDLLFPPLYTYIITFVNLIFGNNLIVYRILGIFVFLSIIYMAFCIFSLVFPNWISAIAALVVMAVMQSENTFIAYDYIRFYDLFNYVSFYLLLRVIVKKYNDESFDEKNTLFLAGLFLALAILTRQTSGIIVLFYDIVFFILVLLLVKMISISWKSLGHLILGLCVPFFILLLWILFSDIGIGNYIGMTILSGSKGSIYGMLFNWILDLPNGHSFYPYLQNDFQLIIISVEVTVGVIGLYFLTGRRLKKCTVLQTSLGARVLTAIFAIVAIASTIALYSSFDFANYLSSNWISAEKMMFFINLTFGICLAGYVLKKLISKKCPSKYEVAFMFFSFFLFSVQFGSGTSGGLSLGLGALNFGFVVALALFACRKIPKPSVNFVGKIAVISLVCVLFSTSVAVKVEHPYYWWGMNEESYPEANCTTDLDYFNGIVMTSDEKSVYENFVSNVNCYLGEDDSLYCYSQVMVFYTLANKLPVVKAPVSWFDVSRNSTILDDLEYLQNNNPRMIVFADHGEDVLAAHEKSFGTGEDSYAHRALYEWLLDCKNGTYGNYSIIETYNVDNYCIYLLLCN